MKCIKIFNRSHVLLDEIEDYNGLKYGWQLNGKGTAEFNIALESDRCTETNFTFRNHIEVWDGDNRIWGGQIVALQFSAGSLKVSCYGYLSLLDRRRLRAATYSEMTYGALFTQLLADVNAISETGITIGTVEAGSLNTQRSVTNKDKLLAKLTDLCEDSNNDMEISSDRKLNFCLHKGSDKRKYILEYGGSKEGDNIINVPSLARNALSLANSVYSEITNGSTLTSTKEDAASIALYGYQEATLDANDSIINQSTLDNKTAAEVQRAAYPVNAITLRVINSTLCPFEDISVGDMVTISLIPYWGYIAVLRILEMTHDESSGEREIIVGESIYKPQPPQVKLYRK